MILSNDSDNGRNDINNDRRHLLTGSNSSMVVTVCCQDG